MPHIGDVLVRTGWSAFEPLDAEEHDRGAWWWTEPDGELLDLFQGTDRSA